MGVNNMPKRTIELLDQLCALGFSDDDFRVVHHMAGATIKTHRHYCQGVSTFKPADTNGKVRERLERILVSFNAGRFSKPAKPSVFRGLAQAAVAEIEK
jgi:hypothetical protein